LLPRSGFVQQFIQADAASRRGLIQALACLHKRSWKVEFPVKIDRLKLTEALNEKKATAACVSCGNNNWTLVHEAAIVTQWINVLPAPGIPVSVAICNHCGFIRMHALGPLGLLPDDAKRTEDDNEPG